MTRTIASRASPASAIVLALVATVLALWPIQQAGRAQARTLAQSPMNDKPMPPPSRTREPRFPIRWHLPLGDFAPDAFSPDGERILMQGTENALLLDAKTFDVLGVLSGHSHVDLAMFLLGGERIVTFGWEDATVRLWDGRSGELIETIGAPDVAVTAVCAAADAAEVVLGDADGKLRFHDARDGQPIATVALLEHQSAIDWLTLDHRQKAVVAQTRDNWVHLVDLEGHARAWSANILALTARQPTFDGKLELPIPRDVMFLRDDSIVVVAPLAGCFLAFDAGTGSVLSSTNNAIGFDLAGDAVVFDQNYFSLMSVKTGEKRRVSSLRNLDPADQVAPVPSMLPCSPDGNFMIVELQTIDGDVCLIERSSASVVRS